MLGEERKFQRGLLGSFHVRIRYYSLTASMRTACQIDPALEMLVVDFCPQNGG